MRKTFSEFFEILGYCEKEIEDQISQNNLITKKKKEKKPDRHTKKNYWTKVQTLPLMKSVVELLIIKQKALLADQQFVDHNLVFFKNKRSSFFNNFKFVL